VITRAFCERPGTHAVAPPTAGSGSVQYLGCTHFAERLPTVKELVPIGSNTTIATMRSAGRGMAASPALPANTYATPLPRCLVSCSILGRSGGSLSRIVTTQVTRPGNQGTPGDGFPSSVGRLTHAGK
jgi:hypothetical protein